MFGGEIKVLEERGKVRKVSEGIKKRKKERGSKRRGLGLTGRPQG